MTLEKSERGKLAQKRGVAAEKSVCAWLLARGYEVLHTRYKTKQGEIDIIAMFGQTLVFCEVKARKTHDEAAFALSSRQISRLIATAQEYLATQSPNIDCRFDIFLIAQNNEIQHIVNAIEG